MAKTLCSTFVHSHNFAAPHCNSYVAAAVTVAAELGYHQIHKLDISKVNIEGQLRYSFSSIYQAQTKSREFQTVQNVVRSDIPLSIFF